MDHPAPKVSVESHLLSVVEVEVMLLCCLFTTFLSSLSVFPFFQLAVKHLFQKAGVWHVYDVYGNWCQVIVVGGFSRHWY